MNSIRRMHTLMDPILKMDCELGNEKRHGGKKAIVNFAAFVADMRGAPAGRLRRPIFSWMFVFRRPSR